MDEDPNIKYTQQYFDSMQIDSSTTQGIMAQKVREQEREEALIKEMIAKEEANTTAEEAVTQAEPVSKQEPVAQAEVVVKAEEVVEEEPPKKEKAYKINPNMTGKDFYQFQVDHSNVFEHPFEIKRPDEEDIKQLCELCQIDEPDFCCPDHCCDWDTCRCKTCVKCKNRRNKQRKVKHDQEQTIQQLNYKQEDLHKYKFNVEKDPMCKIVNDGNEDVYQIRRKKQLNWGDNKDKKQPQQIQEAPAEMIKVAEDCIIKNYDVEFEEDGPELRMLGGIRGIKALKVQREYMQDIDGSNPDEARNRFAKYDQKKMVK